MNDEEYYNFVRPYADAMQMLLTRLDVLNHNLYGKSDSRPIHYIQNRIKKKKSLEEKLIRRGKEPTVDNAKTICRISPVSVLFVTLWTIFITLPKA